MLVNVSSGTIVVPTSDTVTAGTVSRYIEGAQLGNVVLKAPALEGTGTATLRLIDPLLGTICEVVADESTTALGTPNFTFYTGTLTMTASTNGTQSAARNIQYNIYYRAKQG